MKRFLAVLLMGVTAGCDASNGQPIPIDSLVANSRWTKIGSITPKSYAARFIPDGVLLDGVLDDPAWQAISWSKKYEDIQGPPLESPRMTTRMKIAWDSTYLYIAAEIEEPHLWGTLADSTKPVWHEDVFEVFIDPEGDTHDYLELGINLLNTRNQIQFFRAYGDAWRSDTGAWFDGFVSRMDLRGTLNDRRDEDAGWSIEIALPWSGFQRYGQTGVPAVGDVWRMNFSRVDWDLVPDSAGIGYLKRPGVREHNWSWTPQGIILMHVPEMWGYVEFRDDDSPAASVSAFHQRARGCLLDTYYRNIEFRKAAGTNARSLFELYGEEGPSADCPLEWDQKGEGFIVRVVEAETGLSASIDHRRHLSFPATDHLTVDVPRD